MEKSQAKLHAPENSHDHHHDVQEIGQDRGPLVTKEIKHLPLETRHLEDRRGRSFVRGRREERGLGIVITAERKKCIYITDIQVIKTPRTHRHRHTKAK